MARSTSAAAYSRRAAANRIELGVEGRPVSRVAAVSTELAGAI
jgi:hypothetical protein